MYCWVVEIEQLAECEWETGGDEMNCEISFRVELICASHNGGSGGGGDPDGDNDGNGEQGGTGGGNNGPSFTLDCDATVTRGREASCSVSVTNAAGDADPGAYTYEWESKIEFSDSKHGGPAPKKSGKGVNTWRGIATESATVSVTVVGKGFTDSKKIAVTPRTGWGGQQLNAPVQYTGVPRADGSLGLYRIDHNWRTAKPRVESGTGPWKGRWVVSQAPLLSSELHISNDYTHNGPAYVGASTTCHSSQFLRHEENYHTVNDRCGSLAVMESFRAQIIAHEREHEASTNACMKSETARQTFAELEAMARPNATKLATAATDAWNKFYHDSLMPAAHMASAYKGRAPYWYVYSKWLHGKHGIQGHSRTSCN